MNHPLNKNSREGFIIVISLTLMLVMMVMGVGLYFSSKQAAEQVGVSINKSGAFYSAESCIAEARVWLQEQAISGPPCENIVAGSVCNAVLEQNLTEWTLAGDSVIHRNRNANQMYACDLSLVGLVDYEGGDGVGFDIGESDRYGKSGTQTKYLYRIRSNGTMSQGRYNFSSTVEVIDSMIF